MHDEYARPPAPMTPAPDRNMPATEQSIRELIELEHARAKREERRAADLRRKRSLAWRITIVVAVIALVVGGYAAYHITQKSKRDLNTCILSKTLSGYTVAQAKYLCE